MKKLFTMGLLIFGPLGVNNLLGQEMFEEEVIEFEMVQEESNINLNAYTYPNPNNGNNFQVLVTGLDERQGLAEISIINLHGELMYYDSYFGDSKELSREIIIEQPMLSGIYLLQLKQGTSTVTKRLFVE